ncbi:Thioredoxin-related protein-like protein [Candidatus Zixiibacteriota bacterium]|nr:Thioredoxin-related protein-like protein [candidate division Zixibacteria bacterium]
MTDGMTRIARFLIIILLIGGITLAGDGKDKKPKTDPKPAIDTTTITWYQYDTGLKLAKQSGKHILVDFTAKWCTYCKKMDRETFANPEVINFINSHFVPIKVDGDSPNELDIEGYKITESNLAKSEYRVTGYPTFWFLKSTSERIGPAPGYRPSDQFLDLLYFVKDDLYEKMSFQDYMSKGGRNSKSQN